MTTKNPHAVALGKKGGRSTSAEAAAADALAVGGAPGVDHLGAFTTATERTAQDGRACLSHAREDTTDDDNDGFTRVGGRGDAVMGI